MDFRFVLSQGYELQDLILLNRVVTRRNQIRWVLTLVFRTLLVVCGAMHVVTALALVIPGDALDLQLWYVALMPLLLGSAELFLGVGFYRVSAWASRKKMLMDTGEIVLILNENELREQTQKGIAAYPYASFSELICFKGTLFAFLDKHHAFIIAERNLTEGQWQNLPGFMERKTGKPVKYIK